VKASDQAADDDGRPFGRVEIDAPGRRTPSHKAARRELVHGGEGRMADVVTFPGRRAPGRYGITADDDDASYVSAPCGGQRRYEAGNSRCGLMVDWQSHGGVLETVRAQSLCASVVPSPRWKRVCCHYRRTRFSRERQPQDSYAQAQSHGRRVADLLEELADELDQQIKAAATLVKLQSGHATDA